MHIQCARCSSQFTITDHDRAFYSKLNVTAPTHCPECRKQRRLAFRNERNLYHRNCDLCGKKMVTMYHPQGQKRVYCQECWWSDKWDAEDYGRDFDFDRPFFEQFHQLFQEVPRISLINKDHVNSEYCNFAIHNKNSYLLYTTAECEDSFYLNRSWRSRNICDCSNVIDSELCYEVIDSSACYNCKWLQSCNNCSDCTIGYDLQGCKNCFGCSGLVNAQFHIFNKKYAPAAYKEKIAELNKDLEAVQKTFEALQQSLPRRYSSIINSENSSGEAIFGSKNAATCFRVQNVQDCSYVSEATFLKDCMDVNNDDHSELVYESIGSEGNYMHRFNDICWYNRDITYCSLCFHSKNLFGCIGIKRGAFSILNKQYSEKEYGALREKVVAHMKKPRERTARARSERGSPLGGVPSEAELMNQEFGEFFPMRVSPFAYNESVVMDYYWLERDQALSQGLRWKETSDSAGSFHEDALHCSACGRSYKMIPQELSLYRQMGISTPQKCPNCRHFDRSRKRNPDLLYKRQCMHEGCKNTFETTYGSEHPVIVYCEKCYLEAIY